MGLRKMSPGGYEYLTRSVACGDAERSGVQGLAAYYTAAGYPAGQWVGTGARELDLDGDVTSAHLMALFGEGRHPETDQILADQIAAGASTDDALRATQLGRRFAQYGGTDDLRRRVGKAYKDYNSQHGRPVGAPLDETTRAQVRDQVYRQAFAEAKQRQPHDTTELNSWLGQQKQALRTATAGFELVFAPDKATSSAWALGDRATSERIATAHRQAVADAVAYFEREVAFTRHGDHGEAQVDVRGVIGATFEHWDARSGDPHLHTHVPISNKVQRAFDGKWTSLDGRTVHKAAVTVSEYYNSRYRDLLREQGATFVQRPADGVDVKHPVWELAGVPAELVRAWSQRTQQVDRDRARRIVQFRKNTGREPSPNELWEISRQAKYGNRPAKAAPQSLDEHRGQWRAFAESVLGHETVATLARQVFATAAGQRQQDIDVAAIATGVRDEVSDYRSTFTRWNLEAEAHRQTAGLALGADQREALVDRVVSTILAQPDTVVLQAPAMVVDPQALRRRSGESVFAEHNATRITTEQTLREERQLVAWGREYGGHRPNPMAVGAAVQSAQRAGTTLNTGQHQLVTGFAGSSARLQLALAPAGTGKTTAMRVFADAWRRDGGRVYAFGPSARAAQELGQSINARPHTLHKVCTALDLGLAAGSYPFQRGDVLLIDEAAMSGTHTLHRVVEYALHSGADVRLLGDDRQLTAVEAGGAVRLLAHDVGAIRLSEVMRFRDPDQAQASLQLRAGDPDALDYYDQNDRIAAGSIETMRAEAQHAWRADLDAGRETLLIVPRNDDVVNLNLQAREQRVARGQVRTGTETALHDGTRAGRGDWIVTRLNKRNWTVNNGRDFVKNGDTWTVLKVGQDGGLRVRHREHRGSIELPANYVREDVELAYAATVNRCQGMTVRDRAHTVVTPETTHEQFYPSMTRAAGENLAYVVTTEHVADEHQETPPERTARDVLEGVLAHSGAEWSATEVLRQAFRESESLATLVERHTYAADRLATPRYERLLHQHAPEALDTDATDALLQTLRNAENTGWQAERLLARATGGLDDAQDPAAVLVHRIEHLQTGRAPARIAEPAADEVARWAQIVRDTAGVEPTGGQWERVWQHAARGPVDGHDADAAVTTAAERLAQRPSSDPLSPEQYTAREIVTELREQQTAGDGQGLPWLAQHHRAGTTRPADDGMLAALGEYNSAIAGRASELAAQVHRDQPDWASELGTRPQDPDLAQRWDQAAGWAAAYRETYGMTSTDSSQPVGQRPAGNGPSARGWDAIKTAWSATMNPHDRDAQQAYDELRRTSSTLNAEYADDDQQLHQQYEDDEAMQRAAQEAHGMSY